MMKSFKLFNCFCPDFLKKHTQAAINLLVGLFILYLKFVISGSVYLYLKFIE